MIPPENIQDLVARARSGDRQAMETLLEALRPRLEMLAREYADAGRGDGSAADLVQEAWLRAWQKLGQFEGGASDEETLAKLRAWVEQIVHRLGLNARRDRNAQRRRPQGRAIVHLSSAQGSSRPRGASPPASGPTPSANVRQDEEAALVRSALEKLPEPLDREILRLRVFEGVSLRQIAEQLAVSYDRVRERYRVSLRLLERELGDLQ
jgi:RNA polymerase sigma factor (sigma-70 family)